MEDRNNPLAKLDLFDGLSERELSEFTLIGRRRRLRQCDVLFHKGDDGSDLYIILKGKMKAFTTGPEGDDVVFRYMDAGELIGEIGAFAEGKRTATVGALEDCELMMFQRRELLPLLRRYPELAIRLLGELATRLKELSESLEDNNFRHVSARLAKCLVSFADRWSEPVQNGGVRIKLRIPQSDLGDLVGATRESVNKLVRQWSTDGHVEMHDKVITIKNRAALEELTKESGVRPAPKLSAPAARSRAGTSARPRRGKERPAGR